MADSHPPQPTTGPAAKTRNPIERLLVWGLIGALLVAVAVEFQSRKSHDKALTALAKMVEDVDKDASKPEVTEADVKAIVGDKKPVKTEELLGAKTAANGAKRVDVYSWFTLNPASKRELWVWYGAKGKASEDATVIEVQSSENIAPPPKQEVSSAVSNDGEPMAGRPGGGGKGGGPRGGGRGGPRGRPGPSKATDGADKADAEKGDANQPDATTPDDDQTGADNASEEKTAEDKTEKTDSDKE